jgi:hypothetical protein
MRTSYDQPDKMRDLFRQLTVNDATRKTLDVVDNLLQRLTIIGEILSFKSELQTALNEVTIVFLWAYGCVNLLCGHIQVMHQRIPFLMNTIDEFKSQVPDDHPEILVRVLCVFTYIFLCRDSMCMR